MKRSADVEIIVLTSVLVTWPWPRSWPRYIGLGLVSIGLNLGFGLGFDALVSSTFGLSNILASISFSVFFLVITVLWVV